MKKKFLSGMMALCMVLAMVLSVIATPLTAKAEDSVDSSSFLEIGVKAQKEKLFNGEQPVFVRSDNEQTLVDGTDYIITSVSNGTETLTDWDFTVPGRYFVDIQGIGNYCDIVNVFFDVYSSEKDFSYLGVCAKDGNIPNGTNPVIGYMDGESFVELEEGKDYTIEEFDNTVADYYTLTVTGQGAYEGSVTVYFNVLSANDLSLYDAGLETVDGKKVFVVKKSDGVILTKDTDYSLDVSTENGPYNGDTYTEDAVFFFTVTGINDYTGSIFLAVDNHTYDWIIGEPASEYNDGEKHIGCTICGLRSSGSENIVIPQVGKITLSTTKYTYSGTKKAPTVTVKDVDGNKIDSSNYTVSNPKVNAVGTHKVTVTFKNEYDGEKTLTYTINPKAVSIKSLKATKKGFTVTWPKSVAANATGYEIKYSLKSSMASAKTVKVTSYKTASKTIQKLQAKKKYYVQMRVYKKVGKKTFYSAWSAKKSVTTKK